MQSADFEEDLYKNWFRRPTLFAACAWFLQAVAGRIIIRLAMREFSLGLMLRFGVDIRVQAAAAADFLFQAGLLALPVANYARNHPGVEQSMRVRAPHPVVAGYAVGLAVAAVPLCGCVSGWWTLLIRSVGGAVESASAAPATAAGLCGMLLLQAVLPGLCEETLFRGGLMGAWERRGAERALVISSLAFAGLHGSVQGLPVHLLLGFSLGWIVMKSGSLWIGVIFHIVYNSAAIITSYLFGSEIGMNIYTLSQPATTLLIADTVASGALFGLLLIGLKALCGRLVPRAEGPKRPDLTPMEPMDLVVLAAGVVTVMIGYLEDILKICGVL
ncbi:MAG: CPBP family intramembrane metalloprotease [Clostridia bacterium]|nr:CPBP family intramembrane metalloprotease [Clostridia bacterium]